MNKLHYCKLDTPIGKIKIVGTKRGVCFVDLVPKSEVDFKLDMEKRFGVRPIKDVIELVDAADEFIAYFAGELKEFTVPLDISAGTEFQKTVWTHLRKIPFGQVRSYKWLAERIGKPKACRAVGNANGKNPIPIIIPCHRIIETNGGLGGFSSGIDIKRRLLMHEGVAETDFNCVLVDNGLHAPNLT